MLVSAHPGVKDLEGYLQVGVWVQGARLSRTDPLELHVPNAVADLAEEDLLLHPMGEAYGPTDLRPCPAMAFRDHVDQVLGMVRLRVPFVRAEVGAVLETRLGDHASTCEVLVGPEAEVEVRLDLL